MSSLTGICFLNQKNLSHIGDCVTVCLGQKLQVPKSALN